MNLLRPVTTIMTNKIVTLRPDDKLQRVKTIFDKHNIHHIPVEEEHRVVGMVSKSDFLNLCNGFGDTEEEKAKEATKLAEWDVTKLMTKKLAKVETTDNLRTVLDVFLLNRFHALPVTEEGYLVGIVTTFDILKALAKQGVSLDDYKSANS